MSEEELKLVIASYQQKSFELFNQTVVLETQVTQYKKNIELLSDTIKELNAENEKLKSKKSLKSAPLDNFE